MPTSVTPQEAPPPALTEVNVQVGGFDEGVRAGEDVRFLKALRRLGRRRRPTEALATRFTARRLGLQAPLAATSCRRVDRRGDWHMIFETLRGLFYLLFAPRKLGDLIQRYWYDEDNRP